MVSGKAWRWLEGLDPQSIAERAAEEKEQRRLRAKQLEEDKTEAHYNRVVKDVIKNLPQDMRNIPYPPGYQRVTGTGQSKMDFNETREAVNTAISTSEDVKAAISATHDKVTELKDAASAIYEAIPGSVAAETAVRILNEAIASVDEALTKVEAAESELTELQNFFGGAP